MSWIWVQSSKWKLLSSKWRTTVFCLQICWLLLPVLWNALKSILLFWRQQLAISSRLLNLLVPDEGVQNVLVLNLVKDDFGFVGRGARPSDRGSGLKKIFFRPFEPPFGLKIKGALPWIRQWMGCFLLLAAYFSFHLSKYSPPWQVPCSSITWE